MLLELDLSNGNLLENKQIFILDDENFLFSHPELKKHFIVNGFDTYGFDVVIFEECFGLNIIFNKGDFDSYFFLTSDGNCFGEDCLKSKLKLMTNSISMKLNQKPKKRKWNSLFIFEWGGIELNAIKQDYSISMKIYNCIA